MEKAISMGEPVKTMQQKLVDALNSFDEMSQPEVIVGVMKRLKDVNVAFQYFRWVEGKTEQGNCAEVYNAFLMVMARTRNLEYLEQILEEMSLAGFGISNHELQVSPCIFGLHYTDWCPL
ncbi:hypothetical protein TSUD_256790 [Trifolium subterraneum]|uniref:Pentatricopeptide repeat-containing protein n=1 Tax=Trifolium subterraneum TaxID=3900 RepID=A0A2Z6M8Y7_TRISU|nr:hypothetical protein TSUD_256790 [Trifolium subterraneum]